MKVVVTSQGTRTENQVDPRFGRAKCLLLCDTETGQVTSHDNRQNLEATEGAGLQTSQFVASLGAEAVVTGNVGPKAFLALRARRMDVYVGAEGTVEDALAELRAGRLQRASVPTVEGHWMEEGR